MYGIDVNKLGLQVNKIYQNTKQYSVFCPFEKQDGQLEQTANAVYDPINDRYICYAHREHSIYKNASSKIALKTGGTISISELKFNSRTVDISGMVKLPLATDNHYLNYRRGVDNNLIEYFDIRQDLYGNIYFPVKYKDNILAFQKRNTQQYSTVKYVYYGKSNLVYNLNNILDVPKNKLYVVEGVFGVINAYKYGLKNVVAIFGVSNINNTLINYILSNYELYFVFDNDLAGQEASKKVKLLNPLAKVHKTGLEADEINWTTDIKDCDFI